MSNDVRISVDRGRKIFSSKLVLLRNRILIITIFELRLRLPPGLKIKNTRRIGHKPYPWILLFYKFSAPESYRTNSFYFKLDHNDDEDDLCS